jgi:very-short-patch-repair endonuclease
MTRSTLLSELRERVLSRIQRGPLLDISIGRSSRRFDLLELANDEPKRAYTALDAIVRRTIISLTLPILEDEDDLSQEDIDANVAILKKVENIRRGVSLYQRETGVNPLYLAFPLVMLRERDVAGRATRCIVAPVFVWPLILETSRSRQGEILIGFDKERSIIHENPALGPWIKDHFGIELELEKAAADLSATDVLTPKIVLSAARTVFEGFQRVVVMPSAAPLRAVPAKDGTITANEPRIFPSAAVSIIDWVHQAIVNDLTKLGADETSMDVLDTFLGLRSPAADNEAVEADVPEHERFFVADADPAQQRAVFRTRGKNGLIIHGPPGTGKSQTIVNVVIDAVARGEKVLVVCQKQAAINVVSKRLAKEGFRDLYLVVHDAMKDRVQVIDALENQVAAWPPVVRRDIEQQRQVACSEIVRIESELKAYNEALWTAKSRGGLSCRSILARLVQLKAGGASVHSDAKLRAVVVKLTYAELQELKARLQEIAPIWARAELTENLWRFVKSFDFNEASEAELMELLEQISERLGAREAHLRKAPLVAADIDAEKLQAWVDAYGELFANPAIRPQLAWVTGWRDFVASLPSPAAAERLLQQLAEEVKTLSQLVSREAELPWVDTVASIEAASLAALRLQADMFIERSRRWFTRLIPVAKKNRSALLAAASELGVTCDVEFAASVASHCEYVSALRDSTASLHQLLSPLGVDPNTWSGGAATLSDYASGYLDTLNEAERSRLAIDTCPSQQKLLEALHPDHYGSIERVISHFQESCARYRLDQEAREALRPLREFLGEPFFEAVERRLVDQKSILPAIERLRNDLRTIPAIQRYNFFRSRLSADGIVALDILAAGVTADEAVPADGLSERWRDSLEVAALMAWKKELEAAHPELVQTPSEHYRSQVAKLEQLDRLKKELNRQLLFCRQSEKPIAGERAWRGILVKKGRGSKRLRQVVALGAGQGLFHLRPIWLTNPETASQIFPLKNGLFDVVVFDEASQLPPEFAVGALSRAKRAVVSGDEHQLPPTSFFQSGFDVGADAESESKVEELEQRLENDVDGPELIEEYERLQSVAHAKSSENLLAIAKRVLPESWLTIHYRSRFAELIRFSNAAFYENKLRMPTAHPPESLSFQRPIQVHRIDSTYDSDQTNPGEAAAVVAHLRSVWLNGRDTVPTTGVVTFNIHQRDAILDALKSEAEKDRVFADVLSREENRKDEEEDIGFFVKNLENVQGDERDVMIFSTTFGKRANGKFARFFGPLSQTGGQRRLNVAVTRARDRIEIFTSIPTDKVSDALTRPLESVHTGVKPRDVFQLYLAYAEACHAGAHERVEDVLKRAASLSYGGFVGSEGVDDYDSEFEMQVADLLRRNGFKVLTQVNEGEFRIDLAIVHPTENRYALGIECDGATFHSSWSARSHDIWRQRVLESCGWRIYRVWSTDWWRDTSTQVDALLHTARAACGAMT